MPSTRRPIAAVVVAAFLFGTSGTAQELGPDLATPLGVGAIRIAIGAATLWAVVLLRSARSGFGVASMLRTNAPLIVVGAIGVAVYTPLFLSAADRAGVAIATVVTISSGPMFTAVLEWGTRRQRPSNGWLVGTAITIGGAALLAFSVETPAKDVDVVGIVMAMLAGLGYACYSIAAKSTMERGTDSTVALAAPFTLGALILAVVAIAEPYAWVTTASGATMALHLGILATGVAYVLYGYGLDRLTASTTVTLVLAEPLTAVLLATIVLDEEIGPVGWLGIVAVVVGLWVVGRSARPSKA